MKYLLYNRGKMYLMLAIEKAASEAAYIRKRYGADYDQYTFYVGSYNSLARFAQDVGLDVPLLDNHPAYREALKMKTIDDIKSGIAGTISEAAKEAGKAEKEGGIELLNYFSVGYAFLCSVAIAQLDMSVPILEEHPAYKEALKCD